MKEEIGKGGAVKGRPAEMGHQLRRRGTSNGRPEKGTTEEGRRDQLRRDQ